MIRKIIISLLLPFIFITSVWSQEEEPTATKAVTDKIQELKERVANRVEALKKEKLSGLTGLVKSSSEAALILIKDEVEYSVQLDEEAKVYSIDTSLRKKEIKLSAIEKDTTASIIGTIDEDEKTAVAQLVVSEKPNIAVFGTVSSVSTKDGSITVSGKDDQTYIIDIEVSTKSNSFNPETNEFTKIGLSKIEQGSRIHVYAVPTEEENKLTAVRVLILPKNVTTVQQETPTPTVKPTATKKPTATPTETE